MKKLLLFTCIASLFLISCGKDDPEDPSGGSTQGVRKLDCRYDENITLENHREGVDYVAECFIDINNANLKIEPGVVIEFAAGSGLEINADGSLTIEGTSGEEVIMRSDGNGTWRGIHIASNSTANKIRHARIIDAGHGESFFLFRDITAAITNSGRISITDSEIIGSGGSGILSRDELEQSKLSTFKNITISNCDAFPVMTSPENLPLMDLQSCTFEQNESNFIGIDTRDKDRLETDLTLEEIDIPYLLLDDMYLYAGLTLESGVDLAVDNGVILECPDKQEAFISIAGSQTKHVTIRGREAISGYWKGLHILSRNVKNVMEYLDISDAGSEPVGWADDGANITVGDNGRITINDCTSARSLSGCDVTTYAFTAEPTLENNSPSIGNICTN